MFDMESWDEKNASIVCDERSLTARTEDGTCNILDNPAEGSAHANFGLAKSEGEAAGLQTEQFISQERFLNGTFAEMLQTAHALGQAIDVRQLQTLTHPAQMGRPFRVLLQSR